MMKLQKHLGNDNQRFINFHNVTKTDATPGGQDHIFQGTKMNEEVDLDEETLEEAPNKHFQKNMAATKSHRDAIERLQGQLKNLKNDRIRDPIGTRRKTETIKKSIKQHQDALKQIRMTGRPS